MTNKRRAVAFIDEPNLARQADRLKIEIDYQELLVYLNEEYDLVRAYLYSGMDLNMPRVKSFMLVLKRSGYRVVNRRVERDDGSHKGDIDVHLAVDMVTMADWYDTALLFSGDGDFAPAIEAVARKGKRVEVFSLKSQTADIIFDVADRRVDLEELASRIEFKRSDHKTDAKQPSAKNGAPPEVVGEVRASVSNSQSATDEEADAEAAHLFVQVLAREMAKEEPMTLPFPVGWINVRMKEMNPDFDVKKTRFKKFGTLASFIEGEGVIRLCTNENGSPCVEAILLSE